MWKTNSSKIKDLEIEVKGLQTLIHLLINMIPESVERSVKEGIDKVRAEEKVRRFDGGTTGSITSDAWGNITGTRRKENKWLR